MAMGGGGLTHDTTAPILIDYMYACGENPNMCDLGTDVFV